MHAVCPKHRYALSVQKSAKLSARYGKDVWVGECPMCSHPYIGIKLSRQNTYVIDGVLYEFCPSLHGIPTEQQQPKSQFSLSLPDVLPVIPKSTLLKAPICRRNGRFIGHMCIVSDAADQHRGPGVFWVGRTFPATVLLSISMGTRKFNYRGQALKVGFPYRFMNGGEKYLDIISRFCNPENPQSVIVYSKKNISLEDNDNYEMVTAMVPCAKSDFPIPLQVYYDKHNKLYWLDEHLYDIAKERYGLPYLRICTMPSCGQTIRHGLQSLRPISDLRKFGYSVAKDNGMSVHERQALLCNLIDQHLMYKHQIINHLTMLINLNSNTSGMENSVAEWDADLRFILSYNADVQRHIWVNEFKTKFGSVPMSQ